MTRKPALITVIAIAVAALGYWIYHKVTQEQAPEYRFAKVERGDLESAVSATGTLSAVKTVEIGTQVSGQISAIYVDFNDKVKKGQLIARIDPTLQEQAVQTAQAQLERARAEAEKARLEFERNERLFQNKVLTEVEFNTAKYGYSVAQASLKSAQINLGREKRNLQYTQIHAPIDGIVVERNMDAGQTVAASYSTPKLFLIANDLKSMQILAAVDESDIGVIQKGQSVRFHVQAYPNQTFQGTVDQVRLQSKTTENVVNYTVAISVPNPSGKLLPGMTATVEFLTGSAFDVLLAPNTALRFRPPESMLAKLREDAQKKRGASAAPAETRTYRAQGRNGSGPRESNAGTLWYLDAQGKPAIARVRTGISDGQKTAVEGPRIKDGMQVIIGLTQSEENSGGTVFSMGGPRRRTGGPR